MVRLAEKAFAKTKVTKTKMHIESNSKFNEIVSQIMARKQDLGNTKHTDGAKAREQQTDREIMEYARSAFRKDVFGDS